MRNAAIILCFFLFGLSGFSQQTKFYRTYGEGIYNSGQAVLQTYADSGFVVCGGINAGDANGLDMMLFKTDSLGVQEWRKSIGGPGVDFAKHMCYSPGGNGYLLVGYTNRNGSYDLLMVATDLAGDTLWTKVYGGADWDMAYCVDTTYDGGYVISGETYSYGAGNSDMWVLRTDAMGDTLWTRTIGGTADDNARWVLEDPDSNIVLTGSTTSYGAGGSDLYMVYLDETGDTIWTQTVGTTRNEYGYSCDMYFDVFGNVSFMGGGNTEYENPDFITFYNARIGNTGNLIFLREGGSVDEINRNYTRIRNEGNTGRFYMAFQLRYSFDPTWDIEFERTYYTANFGYVVEGAGSPYQDEYNYDVLKTHDLGYILVGEIVGSGPNVTSCYLMKVDSVGASQSAALVGTEEEEDMLPLSLYPNPAGDVVHLSTPGTGESIKAELISITGVVCREEYWSADQQNVFLDLSGLPAGIYFVRVNSGGHSAVRKLIRR